MADENILEVKNLYTGFKKGKKELKIIRGVDIAVKKGEVLGIVGESGSGKSVTMKSIMGILPSNANIKSDYTKYNSIDLNTLTDKERKSLRGSGMAMIFQDPMTALNPLRTIGYHMEEVILRHITKDREESRKIAIDYLAKVGIPSPEIRLKQYPHEFSGGMRQRVLIAMCLSCKPDLLIADEPTTALDVTIQAQIIELLQHLQKSIGISIILITHDLAVVASMCKRIVVMYGGVVMEEADTNDIFYSPKHPYTKALLESIPRHNIKNGERLKSILGNPPVISTDPKGCPFSTRCNYVKAICKEEVPMYTFFSKSHKAMCFNFKNEGGN